MAGTDAGDDASWVAAAAATASTPGGSPALVASARHRQRFSLLRAHPAQLLPCLEALKAAVKARLARVLRLNRTRTDFREKFESLVEEYNAGSRDAEQLAAALIELTQGLDAEEQRHVRESLTIEELVIFDILTRPAPVLTDEERASVRRVAKEMLARVKELLAPHWREKAAARAGAKLAIEDALDSGLPEAYSPEMFRLKVGAVFEHIYESYPSRDSSVYSGVA